MGFFRRQAAPTLDIARLAEQVAEQVKASLPETAFAQSPTAAPETRGYPFGGSAFGPGIPIVPVPIDPRDPTSGIFAPRRSDYASSVNLQITGTRMVPFTILRDTADVDVLRRCIELRKSQMLALDWDITLTQHATRRVMRDQGITSPGEAAQLARSEFEPEIIRLREWWEKPDPLNSMDFATWLQTVLEEQLVIDAVTIWPRRKLSGVVVGMEVLDGSTIKPLLDRRGATPQPPAPAYQQILRGFPRGEYTSTDGETGIDSYAAGQLVYRPRHRRTWTPYGNPETEQALLAANTYLKRMTWIAGEFDAGRMPDQWITSPETSQMTPGQMAEWEQVMNADMANPANRRQLRMLPPGSAAKQMKNFAELYKPELDEFLIKLLCSCFDVMPTEIGFPPSSGIGGKGHQEGEANSAWRKAIRPTAMWLEGLITDLSRRYLGMPPELEFKFLGYEAEDQNRAEQVADSQVRRGGLTLNEERASRGLPLYDFEEADTPFIVTGAGLTFIDGAINAQAATQPTVPTIADAPQAPVSGAAEPASPTDPRTSPAELQRAEAAKFVTYLQRRPISSGRRWRDFQFKYVAPSLAAELNDAGKADDLAAVKSLVATLGKAQARRLTGRDKARLIGEHAPKVAAAMNALFPANTTLVAGWTERAAAVKSTDASEQMHRNAVAYLREQVPLDPNVYDDLDAAIDGVVVDAHHAAYAAGWLSDEEDADPDGGNRLSGLREGVSAQRGALLAAVIASAADALLSDDPSGNLDEILADDTGWADTFVKVEITPAATAGTQDATEAQGLKYVQLVASPGDCEFCDGYDGRIMPVDHDEGMPPLHNGCNCDIEPLD